MESVYQGESLVNWLNWLSLPPAVCLSVIMRIYHLSQKGCAAPVQKPSKWDHQAVQCKACKTTHIAVCPLLNIICVCPFHTTNDRWYMILIKLFNIYYGTRLIQSVHEAVIVTEISHIDIDISQTFGMNDIFTLRVIAVNTLCWLISLIACGNKKGYVECTFGNNSWKRKHSINYALLNT